MSTATLTTALFKRGLRNVFIEGARPLNPASRMAGPAFTLRYIPSREDIDTIEVFKDPRHPQRHAVETIPPGAVMVIDSRGDARAASAGGILVRRMMVRGAAGIVTDGGLRDSPEIAAIGFPAFCRAPSAPTNLVHHHAIDIDVPIGCGGVPVYPGDWVVGDGEGVVVVPGGNRRRGRRRGGRDDRLRGLGRARGRRRPVDHRPLPAEPGDEGRVRGVARGEGRRPEAGAITPRSPRVDGSPRLRSNDPMTTYRPSREEWPSRRP